MMIFLSHGLVCFANPKTGTTALESAFGPRADIIVQHLPGAKHTPVRKYHRLLAPFVESLTSKPPVTMALMREPVEWLGSWYRYRSREAIAGTPKSTIGLSFEEFIEAYLMEDPPDFARVGRQSRFLQARNGRSRVDVLFSYAHFDQAQAFMAERLGVNPHVARENISPVAPLSMRPAVDDALRGSLREDFMLYDALLAAGGCLDHREAIHS